MVIYILRFHAVLQLIEIKKSGLLSKFLLSPITLFSEVFICMKYR
ncbi:hypothetical protein CSC17_5790 [Klebsiella oxytoca]|nr:hypothetical protein CSC17_5790 [Klebsiella oxytoca]